MKHLIFLLLFFFSYTAFSQTFLGKTKQELTEFTFQNYETQKISVKKVDENASYIKVNNDYETLYYYLVNDVCVQFQVKKPYTCNCLDEDITAYNENCISIGEKEWVSKDFSKMYLIALNENDYIVSIVQMETKPELEPMPVMLTTKEN